MWARRNFNILVGDVAFFFIGIAFLDANTVFPVLLRQLGGSEVVLGVVLALRQASFYLPQLWIAHRLQGRPRYLPFLLKVAFFGRAGLFLAAAALWLWGSSLPTLAAGVFVASYLMLWIVDGLGIVAWTALIRRTVSPTRRGRLFATTQMVSGGARLGVGALVTFLLAGKVVAFPVNAALIVLCAALAMAISYVFLALIREPLPDAPSDEAPPAPPVRFGAYLATLKPLLRRRPELALIGAVQVISTAPAAAMPFLIGAIPEGQRLAGGFLQVSVAGLLLLAPLWGLLTDRRGPRTALLALLGMALLAPAAAQTGNLALYYVAYFCFGATSEVWSTVTNYLLESLDDDDETTGIALMSAMSAPAMALPFLASLVAGHWGARAALFGAEVLLTLGVLLVLRLPETRKRPAVAK